MRTRHPLLFWMTVGIATTVIGFFGAIFGLVAGRA